MNIHNDVRNSVRATTRDGRRSRDSDLILIDEATLVPGSTLDGIDEFLRDL